MTLRHSHYTCQIKVLPWIVPSFSSHTCICSLILFISHVKQTLMITELKLKRLSSLSCLKAVLGTHVPWTAEVQLTCPQKTSHDEESSVSSGNLLQSFNSFIVTKILPMSSLNIPCCNWSSNTFLSYPPRVMEKSLSMAFIQLQLIPYVPAFSKLCMFSLSGTFFHFWKDETQAISKVVLLLFKATF